MNERHFEVSVLGPKLCLNTTVQLFELTVDVSLLVLEVNQGLICISSVLSVRVSMFPSLAH